MKRQLSVLRILVQMIVVLMGVVLVTILILPKSDFVAAREGRSLPLRISGDTPIFLGDEGPAGEGYERYLERIAIAKAREQQQHKVPLGIDSEREDRYRFLKFSTDGFREEHETYVLNIPRDYLGLFLRQKYGVDINLSIPEVTSSDYCRAVLSIYNSHTSLFYFGVPKGPEGADLRIRLLAELLGVTEDKIGHHREFNQIR